LFLLSFSIAFSIKADYTNNIQLWLNFENISNNYLRDISGNNHIATNYNTTNWITQIEGKNGNAAFFTKVGIMTNDPGKEYDLTQYAAITNLGTLRKLTNGSWSCWVKWATNTHRWDRIIDTGGCPKYSDNSNLALHSWTVQYGAAATAEDGGVPQGPIFYQYEPGSENFVTNVYGRWIQPRDGSTWWHISATWNASSNKVWCYQNGIEFTNRVMNAPYLAVSDSPAISWISIGAATHDGTAEWGDDAYPNAGFFQGAMDDLRIYTTNLTATQMKLVYEAGLTNFYVTETGSDITGTGALSNPWRTITNAAKKVFPGVIVNVALGYYTNEVHPAIHGNVSNRIEFRANGAETTVRISGFHILASYTTVNGFYIKGSNAVAPYIGAFQIEPNVTNSWFINCRADDFVEDNIYPFACYRGGVSNHQSAQFCIFSNNVVSNMSGKVSFMIYGTSNLLISNYIVNTKGDGIRFFGKGHIARGNLFKELRSGGSEHTDLFECEGNNNDESQDMLIEGNHAWACWDAQIGAIQSFYATNVDGTYKNFNWIFRNNLFVNVGYPMSMNMRCDWYNNTFVNCATSGPVLAFSRYDLGIGAKGDSTGSRVLNNIFWGCGKDTNAGWYSTNFQTGITLPVIDADYNYVGNIDYTKKNQVHVGQETRSNTHWWEDHGINGGNLYMLSTNSIVWNNTNSVVYGTGTNLSAFVTGDYFGTVRGGRWDIGGYHYGITGEGGGGGGEPPIEPPGSSSGNIYIINAYIGNIQKQ